VTAVVLGIVAVAQRDLKQLLAASTCAQIGYMLLAAGAGATLGGALQLMAHAAAKSLLFLVAGAWLTVWGTQQLSELRAAARTFRAVGVVCTIGALALAGLPPLALWAAKDVLLAAALEDSTWLYAAGLAAAALSAVYSVRILRFVWDRPDQRSADGRRVPGGAVAPLVLPAAACAALTPVALPPVRDTLAGYLGAQGQPVPHVWEFALSGVLALGAAALAWTWRARPVVLPLRAKRWCRNWLGLERAAHVLFVSPTLRMAHAAAVLDDRVLARAVDGAGRAALACGRGANRFVERAIDSIVNRIASVTRALGRRARRPQTGQLHQYLAQSVTAFSVIAVVLVLVR
jgi:NADH:ubiquinone oxidoreductase subunit 5 (subunit L)/multisubunit Na+/H+ antiporter MnhA subunit